MVIMQSPYPKPPPAPETNIHNITFNISGQGKIDDYVLAVDGLTGRKRTFYEFREQVYSGAAILGLPVTDGGLELDASRDIVGLYSGNCLDYGAVANALLMLTVPFSLISAFSTTFELAHCIRTSGVTRLFVQPELLDNAIGAATNVGFPMEHIHVLEGHSPGRRSFQDMVDEARKRRLPRATAKAAKKDTLAYMVFSSGTTGLPKAVMITHGNVLSMLMGGATTRMTDEKYLKLPPPASSVCLLALPLNHAFGFFMCCVRPFSNRTTVVYLPRWDTLTVLRAIPKYKVTDLFLVPSAMLALVNHPEARNTELSSLRSAAVGAAYTPSVLFNKFKSFMNSTSHLVEGYGSSEMTLSVARRFPPGVFNKRVPDASLGVLTAGVEGKIMRPDGTEADYDEPGELWVRGPTASPGYFNNPEATREVFVDGWVRTGDTMRFDRDGYLYFIDRAKDTLKIGGAQVSPTEIEDVIRAQPDGLVLDLCVAGVSGGRTSDEKVPRAWIVLSDAGKRLGAERTLKVLEAWSQKSLSRYKWLRGGWEVVDEIPKNATGKLLRRVLQDKYEKEHGVSAKAKL